MEKITKKDLGVNVAVAIIITTILAIIIIPNMIEKTDDSAFRNEFLAGCMTESNFEFCNCTYDEIKKDVGLDGLGLHLCQQLLWSSLGRWWRWRHIVGRDVLKVAGRILKARQLHDLAQGIRKLLRGDQWILSDKLLQYLLLLGHDHHQTQENKTLHCSSF